MLVQDEQEINVSEAFSRQSVVFDAIEKENAIHAWIRDRVRAEVLRHSSAGAKMLELNCGTGLDAVFFATQGMSVLATDNAPGMLEVLSQKVKAYGLQDKLEMKRCSFNNLQELGEQKFDYVFSNFGGLNCAEDLAAVLRGIDNVLNPGGKFSLAIMPPVCPWELAMLFKGYFRTAFRRFSPKGALSHVEGVHFRSYYYSPSFVIRHIGSNYSLLSLKGLAAIVPPPFIGQFCEKHPRLFSFLEKIENRLCDKFPFNRWCDHYVITMQKR
jgi:ubiquinone/menaquinone biosynthesis C-methylase UbiE